VGARAHQRRAPGPQLRGRGLLGCPHTRQVRRRSTPAPAQLGGGGSLAKTRQRSAGLSIDRPHPADPTRSSPTSMIGARERPTESPRWSYAPQPQPNPNLTTMRGHSVSPAHLGTPPSAPGGACLATVAPQKNAAQDAPQAASFPRAPEGPP
jgi:hypothetical protein